VQARPLNVDLALTVALQLPWPESQAASAGEGSVQAGGFALSALADVVGCHILLRCCGYTESTRTLKTSMYFVVDCWHTRHLPNGGDSMVGQVWHLECLVYETTMLYSWFARQAGSAQPIGPLWSVFSRRGWQRSLTGTGMLYLDAIQQADCHFHRGIWDTGRITALQQVDKCSHNAP
jgi:hypothetical protein